ncbi:hypothetical protein HQQ94_18950 [Shewanella sp. VB17]|uniref:hypothetical protein n=1 Tax=Shewanella sp. VB17 TaxID=2739432 RepID=UPI001566FD32|nr:hypothetical protein [Shewanella sp. VB17]NRD75261.1 hypothetical protein [Shewanella sp. VB17]
MKLYATELNLSMMSVTLITALSFSSIAMAADSDGDGVGDSIERMYGWNPYDENSPGEADYDGDGLTDLTEFKAFTNIYDANKPVLNGASDNDHDNLSKGLEVFLMGTNPEKEDTDCDGINDDLDSNPVDEVCVADVTIRVGYWASYSIGSTQQVRYNDQLDDQANYGILGTNNKVVGFDFTNLPINLNTYTAAQLKENFDIISTGYQEMTTAQATLIKAYNDLGGVVIVAFDSSKGTAINKAFGGTGSVSSGSVSARTNAEPTINTGVFGDARSSALSGAGTFGRLSIANTPNGSLIVVTEGSTTSTTSKAGVWITGNNRDAIFIWDEGLFRHSSVTGNIDTKQEIFLHNLMSYAIDKVL